MEQNSISLLPPDANYARYLWNNDVDETFDSASPMLVGLSARDMEFLRQKFVSLWKKEKERKFQEVSNEEESSVNSRSDNTHETKTTLVQSIMKSLLVELETKNTLTQPSRSSGGSSTVPLSSTSLPNIRWEDIGGLSAVRKEIMDAVELPLKHPELFEGSRRSGILLFGPPGTGELEIDQKGQSMFFLAYTGHGPDFYVYPQNKGKHS
jgi:SpoVK/Ycf46/Vps4 family AAA+-type ATPase